MKPINKNINQKNKNTSKSNRNRNLIDKTVQYYQTKYAGTKLLPRTPIFNYIFNNFLTYEKEKQEKEIPFTFQDAFSLNDQLKNVNDKTMQLNVKGKLSPNPSISLDKFIAYCFYITDSSIFKDASGEVSVNRFIQGVKNQSGKDVQRTEIKINDVLQNNEIYSKFDTNNYLKADLYVKNVLKILNNISKIIDYNLLNKILLLTCQNVFNAMVSMLNVFIQKIFAEENRFVIMLPLQSEKNMILNKENIFYNVYFKSALLISNYNGDIDPENPCGTLEYNLGIDLKNSTYECDMFNIEWDLNKCAFNKPEIYKPETSKPEKKEGKRYKDYMKDPKVTYGLAAGLSTAGIVSVPFILGLLGGKTKKRKILRKKRKTRRRLQNKK